MEFIGVKDPSIELNLKQLLLYFDKIYLTNLEELSIQFKYDCIPEAREDLEHLRNDIDFLIGKGYLKLIDDSVFNIIKRNQYLDKRILKNKDFQRTIKLYNNTHDSFQEKGSYLENRTSYLPQDYYNLEQEINEMGNTTCRMMATILREIKRRDQVLPILDAFLPSDISTKTKLINITIEKFPKPESNVSWEEIFDFKSNEDSKQKRMDLNNWIIDISKSDFTAAEYNQKLEFLILEYEEELKRNKINYKYEMLKVVLKLPLKSAENLIKFRWSELVDPLFKLGELTYDLMKIERNSKYKQVGYIVKSKRKFIRKK